MTAKPSITNLKGAAIVPLANPRKCRHFSESRKFLRTDPGGWLGWSDSNFDVQKEFSSL
jgi:hypothetical protein